MKNHYSNIFIALLFFIGSCSRTSAPPRVATDDIEPMEVQYFVENPTSIQKIENRNEILSRVIENYLDTINSKKIFSDPYRRDYLFTQMIGLYENNSYKMLWMENYDKSEALDHLITYIDKADNYGLESNDYNKKHIKHLVEHAFSDGVIVDILKLIRLDICASSSAFLLASHLNAGRISPTKIDSAWFINPPKLNYKRYVQEEVIKGYVHKAMKNLQPNIDCYWDLQDKLSTYNQLKKQGGLPSIPAVNNLEAGDTMQFILPMKKFLSTTGDLKNYEENNSLTSNFKDALRRYQMRMDIEVTGNPTKATVYAMQQPLSDRINTIELNMERLRWFEKFEDEYIIINVPQFKMQLTKNGEEVISMKIVVGKEYDSTPMFSDQLEYLVFNPQWTVPYTIATEEMLPKIKANPGYLPGNKYKLMDGWGRNAMEVDPYAVNWQNIDEDNFPYVIVQKSGDFNALGAVKFMFPNNYSIYMHDTPAEYLFEKDYRGYSHGCIRLENPFELAEYLLRNKKGWSQAKQRRVMSKEEPVNVYLPEPIPVHIVYQTCWVDKYGNLNFRNDIYGHDKAQLRAINAKENLL